MLIGTSWSVVEYVNYKGLCMCKFENSNTELYFEELR